MACGGPPHRQHLDDCRWSPAQREARAPAGRCTSGPPRNLVPLHGTKGSRWSFARNYWANGLSAGCARAHVHVLDAGHFALDTAADEIAAFVRGFVGSSRLESVRIKSVRKVRQVRQSFLSMRQIEARRRKASAFRVRFSKSLARRRQRLSQAKVRSTTHRRGKTAKPFA